ncbi:ribonuclease HI [Desulfofundulus thermobenzoicus]|uniref:Ribonuclease H n=1 Tax=Desulfofundulus thermobenzoicus TaxID=29376 RepID=A0A6N7IM30_9FIRM|nr:ribonuclease HI [Desulfofundulus thermobenzoicus]MQL51032.1 ribonuclease HI [Desulfofundulus thermobenzoicus]
MADLPEVDIYTDGACSGNPGPGGYGVILRYGKHMKELSGGFARTTNNRMELTAVIKGLQALKRPCRVTLYSDSRYIVDAMTRGWVKRWQTNGWRRDNGEPAKNADLWRQILSLAERHRITWVWVKGHADNPYNNRCDQLAVQASQGDSLPVDEGYSG